MGDKEGRFASEAGIDPSKHMPGSWSINDQCDVGDGWLILVDHPEKSGAKLSIGWIDREADARLMASAPDLLAIAREIADYYEDTDSPLGIRARAAVAKAEGRTDG